MPIADDSVIEFWATSSLGDTSTPLRGTIRRLLTDAGLMLKTEAVSPVTVFQDACAAVWTVPPSNNVDWAAFPLSPEDLNTTKPYQYLSTQLLAAGEVKASQCPGGGLYANGGANACGLEKAASAVIDWQNQFDSTIWDTFR